MASPVSASHGSGTDSPERCWHARSTVTCYAHGHDPNSECAGLAASRGDAALRDYHDLRIERYPHHLFLGRIWELRANATAYDAAYLALAEALDAPLLTTDRKLAGIPGHGARVVVA